jgi:hypothetical protein
MLDIYGLTQPVRATTIGACVFGRSDGKDIVFKPRKRTFKSGGGDAS